MLSKLLFRLYSLEIRKLRKIILALVTRLEGGQVYSETLRKIFTYYHKIEIGKYSYGGCFDSYAIAPFTKIGRYCSFAAGVRVFNGNHPLEFKSMHPFFYNPALGYVQKELIPRTRLIIGNDVWVGHNVLITPNVKSIGDGAAIGSGAVVTKDVPDYAVVAGNPAKIIRYRFSEKKMLETKASKWWEKDIDELRESIEEFTRPLEEKDSQASTR